MPLSRRNVSRDLVSASVDAPPRNGQAPNGSTQRAGDPVLCPGKSPDSAMPAMPSLRFLSHLARVPSQDSGAAGARLYRVRIGNDLLFWSNVAKFAVELLVGEHFLPGMQVHGAGVIQARWLPQYLDTRIEQRRQQLIDSMPPVCRAYDLSDPNQAPFPSELVDHFIVNVVDAAIRKWTADVQPPSVARRSAARVDAEPARPIRPCRAASAAAARAVPGVASLDRASLPRARRQHPHLLRAGRAADRRRRLRRRGQRRPCACRRTPGDCAISCRPGTTRN